MRFRHAGQAQNPLFHLLAGFEANDIFGRHVDSFSRPGIARLARFALLHFKHTEIPQFNPLVFERLHETAKAHEIAVQVRGAPRATGTDANVMQLSREGVATALIGIPNRYMHSPVEVVCLDDLDRAARLLAEFCTRVTPEMDWTP